MFRYFIIYYCILFLNKNIGSGYLQIATASIYTMSNLQYFLLFITLIANSGKYMHLSIVVHYKTVCNTNILSANYKLY